MKRLNQLRLESGYSITDIALLMRVDEETACQWLSGRQLPDRRQQEQLAAIFRVQVHDLDGEEPETSKRIDKLRNRLASAGIRVPMF